MKLFEFIGPERKTFSDRWRTVKLLTGPRVGETVMVGILQGKRVRIMYKRAPHNWGHKWSAVVRDSTGREIFSEPCSKGSGVRGTLIDAFLITKGGSARG